MNSSEQRFVAELVRSALALPPREEPSLYVEQQLQRRGLDGRDDIRRAVMAGIADRDIDFGPLTPLMDDPDVRDIAVNGPTNVWALRPKGWQEEPVAFSGESDLLDTAHRLLRRAEGSVALSLASPVVDARLHTRGRPRICAVLPPAADGGVKLVIRKYRPTRLTVKDLLAEPQSLDLAMAAFLFAAIHARLNMLISGGTGSGKTTLLAVLLGLVPPDERLVLIEDTPELPLSEDEQTNVIRLLVERDGKRDAEEMLRTSLRLSPTRLILGEVRGSEAVSMLQAMNTGHDGSLSTLHANSPRDVVSRLVTMALLATENMPYEAALGQIGAAVNLVVHAVRDRDGEYAIGEIAEVRAGTPMPTVHTIFMRTPDRTFIAVERPQCWERILPWWSNRNPDPFA